MDPDVLALLQRIEADQKEILRRLRPVQKKTKYEPSRDAINCVRAWDRHRPLPDGWEKRMTSYAKPLDLLHTRDHVPWDGKDGIHAICKWAVTEWEEKFIQSPVALRRESKSRAPAKTWEVIRNQIRKGSSASLGDDPTLRGLS